MAFWMIGDKMHPVYRYCRWPARYITLTFLALCMGSLAPPGEYDWMVRVRRWCGLMSPSASFIKTTAPLSWAVHRCGSSFIRICESVFKNPYYPENQWIYSVRLSIFLSRTSSSNSTSSMIEWQWQWFAKVRTVAYVLPRWRCRVHKCQGWRWWAGR